MRGPEVEQEPIAVRQTVSPRDVGKADREAFARNPQDFKAIMRLGRALLAANDPHLARLALSQALQGGGAELLNLYGVACARVEDWSGAFEGFGRAAIAGFEGGIVNAKKLFSRLNMSAAAQRANKEWSIQTSGGELW